MITLNDVKIPAKTLYGSKTECVLEKPSEMEAHNRACRKTKPAERGYSPTKPKK